MAKSTTKKANQITALVSYLKEVRQELSKVVWPSRSDTIKLTTIVLVASVLISIYVGLLDLGFTGLVKTYIIK